MKENNSRIKVILNNKNDLEKQGRLILNIAKTNNPIVFIPNGSKMVENGQKRVY